MGIPCCHAGRANGALCGQNNQFSTAQNNVSAFPLFMACAMACFRHWVQAGGSFSLMQDSGQRRSDRGEEQRLANQRTEQVLITRRGVKVRGDLLS